MNSELLLMIVRKVLTIGGAILVSRGTIAETWLDPELVSGVAMLIVSVAWSKKNAAKLTIAKEAVPELENAPSGKQP